MKKVVFVLLIIIECYTQYSAQEVHQVQKVDQGKLIESTMQETRLSEPIIIPPADNLNKQRVHKNNTSSELKITTHDTIAVHPFEKIQNAIYRARPGTVILIYPEGYQEQIVMQNNITLLSVVKNEAVIYSYTGPIIEGASNAIIDGFTIAKMSQGYNVSGQANIHVEGATNFIVRNNIITNDDFYTMIVNENSSMVVENNYFHSFLSFPQTAAYLTRNYFSPASIIKNNWFNNVASGVNASDNDSVYNNLCTNSVTGIQGAPAEVFNNTIVNCGWSIFISRGNSKIHSNTILFGKRLNQMGIGVPSDAVIRNNILLGTIQSVGQNGFAVGFNGGSAQFSHNLIAGSFNFSGIYCLSGGTPQIVNNTIWGGNDVIYIEGSSSPVVTNNCIVNAARFGIYSKGGGNAPQISYNDYYNNPVGDNFNVISGIGNIHSDPLFVNPKIFKLADISTRDGYVNSIFIQDTSKYVLGDILEYDYDNIARTIIAIEDTTVQVGLVFFQAHMLKISPSLSSPSVSKKIILNWGKNKPTKIDFHLRTGSPCINAGDPVAPKDSDGSRADIGAYYYSPATDVKSRLEIPLIYSLSQNYPNPFNPTTTINFSIPQPCFVTLKVFNVLGEEVAFLVNEEKNAGSYKVIFDARTLASGVYFYRLQADRFVASEKMILLK